MTILLTGFGPFGQVSHNPSELIVRAIWERQQRTGEMSRDLAVAVLDTAFASAAERIVGLLRTFRPELLLSVGVAPTSTAIRLEQVARNRDAATIADNHGVLRADRPIVADAPPSYRSTLPLLRIKAALEDLGVPVALSEDAGGYVCNHVFYVARHTIAQLGLPVRCGFVHVPQHSDTAVPLRDLVDAIERCLVVSRTP